MGDDWLSVAGAGIGWLVRLAVRALLWLWWWGPPPTTAYEPGSYRQRTIGRTYRLGWRTGQVIGWTLIALMVVGITVVVYAI